MARGHKLRHRRRRTPKRAARGRPLRHNRESVRCRGDGLRHRVHVHRRRRMQNRRGGARGARSLPPCMARAERMRERSGRRVPADRRQGRTEGRVLALHEAGPAETVGAQVRNAHGVQRLRRRVRVHRARAGEERPDGPKSTARRLPGLRQGDIRTPGQARVREAVQAEIPGSEDVVCDSLRASARRRWWAPRRERVERCQRERTEEHRRNRRNRGKSARSRNRGEGRRRGTAQRRNQWRRRTRKCRFRRGPDGNGQN